MTVEEMIAERTVKVTAALDEANDTISLKGGIPSADLHGLAAAIASIPSGGELPELTDPAEVGNVLAGKEYIDGAGAKRQGSLVVCESIEEVEYFGIAGTGVSLEIESTADESTKELMLRETNLLPENIKSGINIFGIDGSAKTLRVETGTITPAEDGNVITISTGLQTLQDIVILAAVDDPAELSANAIIKASASKNAVSAFASDTLSDAVLNVLNTTCGVALYRTSAAVATGGVSAEMSEGDAVVSASQSRVFRAGQTYRWTAYGWDD